MRSPNHLDEPASGANPVVSAVDPVLDAKLPEFFWGIPAYISCCLRLLDIRLAKTQ